MMVLNPCIRFVFCTMFAHSCCRVNVRSTMLAGAHPTRQWPRACQCKGNEQQRKHINGRPSLRSAIRTEQMPEAAIAFAGKCLLFVGVKQTRITVAYMHILFMNLICDRRY